MALIQSVWCPVRGECGHRQAWGGGVLSHKPRDHAPRGEARRLGRRWGGQEPRGWPVAVTSPPHPRAEEKCSPSYVLTPALGSAGTFQNTQAAPRTPTEDLTSQPPSQPRRAVRAHEGQRGDTQTLGARLFTGRHLQPVRSARCMDQTGPGAGGLPVQARPRRAWRFLTLHHRGAFDGERGARPTSKEKEAPGWDPAVRYSSRTTDPSRCAIII